MTNLPGILLFVVSASAQVTATLAVDRCEPLLPVALRKQMLERYPAYTLPREADNEPENVKYSVDSGGTGCLGIAAGDFNAEAE